MKKLVNLLLAAFSVLVISSGLTSCNKDTMGEIKLIGTWKTEKMVRSITVDGKTVSETITLDKGDDDMFKSMVFSPDGTVLVTFKDGEFETGKWKYSDGILSFNTEDSGNVSIDFNVEELTMKSLVISMSDRGATLSYYFKK